MYTSGTDNTPPKNVVLTHDNFIASVQVGAVYEPLEQGRHFPGISPPRYILEYVVELIILFIKICHGRVKAPTDASANARDWRTCVGANHQGGC